MKATSLIAFQEINLDGTLGRRQKLAYQTLLTHGPMTGQELSLKAASPGLWKRMSELERLGVIRADGARRCPITGRLATIWRALDPSGVQLDIFSAGSCT